MDKNFTDMNSKQILVWALAGFLIVYHTVKIYSGMIETPNIGQVFSENYYQNTIRLLIVCSLFLVLMFSRIGLGLMWVFIVSLIVTQYLMLPTDKNLAALLGPLKGLIFPTVISLIFWHQRKPQQHE